MVSKCANPACGVAFRYLHEGKLFRIERPFQQNSGATSQFADNPIPKKPASHVEFFWLCRDCSQTMTLSFEKGVGIIPRPLVHTIRSAS